MIIGVLIVLYCFVYLYVYSLDIHQQPISKTIFAIIGMCIFINFINWLHVHKVRNILIILGENTLPIYMFHSIFVSIVRKAVFLFGDNNVIILINILLGSCVGNFNTSNMQHFRGKISGIMASILSEENVFKYERKKMC